MARNLWQTPLPQSVLEVTGAVAVFGAGVLIGSTLKPTPADWIGFLGALIGAGLTVAGSIYVLDRERTRELRQQANLLTTLLDEVDQECIPFQVANQAALLERYGRTAKEQVGRLIEAINRVHRFKDSIKPTTARMMKVEDAIAQLEVDPELDQQAKLAGLYPESADFGGLNAIGHDIKGQIANVRHELGQG
ncbi:hypothetical protein [Novosphingobium album (ex Hu et al. 2023)]|uniref:SLATT domain-containing protein n=1 Tax=Novosphingobium album (ex Hu et al. 2023) TaxID=2930093 RepID=A0ABT0B7F6_9SPHN|nr:hypothetical protein [Novosphingobium album (ex Hu et al. 2023)]MCJ2180810.1 hypothetical protein [Novosphingobium album (ex Hu et al. 2023)]